MISVTGYRWSFDRDDASRLLLATHVGDQPLTHGHGAPVRLVAPGRRGFIWVKWVTRIELHDGPDPGAFPSTLRAASPRRGGDRTWIRLRTSRSATGSVVRSNVPPARISPRISCARSTAARLASIHASMRAVAQHVGGQLRVEREQVVAQRGARHRRPAVGRAGAARSGRAASAGAGRRRAGSAAPRRSSTARSVAPATSTMSSAREQRALRGHARAPAPPARPRSASSATRVAPAPPARTRRARPAARSATTARARRRSARPRRAMSSGRGRVRSSQRVAALDQPPPATAASRSAIVGGDRAVERLDLAPTARACRTRRARPRGARDVGGERAGVLAQAEHERRSRAVDQVVGHPRGDDLAPQPVPAPSRRRSAPAAAAGSSASSSPSSAGSSGRSESSSAA